MDMNPFGTGPAGLFAQLAGGFGPIGHGLRPPPARSYDEYYRAYSVAMLPGRERENVSYGGKIIMPQSALASITQLDLEPPWMFLLRNPENPAASTHAGVLEFIAEEGCVHLPHWMMQTLRLNEGDAIRVTGAELPKGQFVKLQAQNTMFLEISDPKAVLEQALRNFSALTQGDIIDISYNSIVFSLLVMETKPGGEGISVINTDLEVDFAAPVGYVEPERPKPAPPSTMASKLNIDVNSQTPGSSRPSSSLGGSFGTTAPRSVGVSKGGDKWESFKGKGETLGGRKTKGKGISQRPVEETVTDSKIIRTDKHRIVTSELLDTEVSAPAPLNLPFGKLFFGYRIVPYQPPDAKVDTDEQPPAFTGSGAMLNGRSTGQAPSGSTSSKGKGKDKEESSPSAAWGSGGNTLGGRSAPVPVPDTNSRGPAPSNRSPEQRRRSPTPDRAYDTDEMESDDDSVIYISDDDD
ncbi:UFD1-domain-containing protein [Rhodofomes roseus]|uniref:UFD1-domain-containing protein n=1 Tax=Rhodofomes roseus TaxID=34475 RepID=A0A4Y9YQH0_9APHY|nr:UFD1-domain-containing protein [Rhodofomes roseus]KAH9833077.1 UFD1-domain-containing protein [Rhodofomes roseus]TFY64684.1 hypothetical protein EVJ58_g2462 [Rhodofomes roseus]